MICHLRSKRLVRGLSQSDLGELVGVRRQAIYNPVKHGQVTRVVAWPYPSFHRYVGASCKIHRNEWSRRLQPAPPQAGSLRHWFLIEETG